MARAPNPSNIPAISPRFFANFPRPDTSTYSAQTASFTNAVTAPANTIPTTRASSPSAFQQALIKMFVSKITRNHAKFATLVYTQA